jgi:catecholate siderophore receptor
LRDIPQTVNVVPQSLLRDQVAQSMQDALKAVPGVGFSHGDGQRDQVTIRGFSAIADQFVDGLRDDALYFRDLSNIEQIEVLKGPASVLYGRGSSGGLINRITKKPGVNLSEVGLTLGRWNQRRGEFDLARAAGQCGLLSPDRRRGARRQLPRPAVSRSQGACGIGADQAQLGHQRAAAGRLSEGQPPDGLRHPRVPGPARQCVARHLLRRGQCQGCGCQPCRGRIAGCDAESPHQRQLVLRNALRYYDYSLDRNNTLVGSVNEKAMTASLTRGNVQRDESGFFNQTELTQKLELAGMKHQLLYGFEFGRQSKDLLSYSRANVATVSLFNPVLPTLPLRIDGKPAADNHSVFKVASLYLQDLVTITPQWKALAGVRYDRFQQETHERQPGKPDLSRTDTAWSPRVGLVYQPSSAWSYYASWSKSFQPSGETFALAANNAQLAPEKTTSQEVGVKWDLPDGKASVTASLFKLERTNIKSVDPQATPWCLWVCSAPTGWS